MTDDEKCFEAFRVTNQLYAFWQQVRDDAERRFRNGTRFPYIIRGTATDDKRNKWTLLLILPSKAAKRKGQYLTIAYTTYEIPPKRKENDLNAGRGIIMFDPIHMEHFINDHKSHSSIFMEVIPHAFNRYTERYLKPRGLQDITFERKVENMITRWMHFDVEADLLGDINAAKHKGDNLCPYDVYMRGGGMLRGQIVNNLLLRFTTYVSPDMMFDNQLKRQQEMMREHWEWKRTGLKP